MNDTLQALYAVIETRKAALTQAPDDDSSYTNYLLRQGTDKILKKVGEECAETIIAAKNNDRDNLIGELADLHYHLLVLMASQNIQLEALTAELDRRAQKIGNKKQQHATDHNS